MNLKMEEILNSIHPEVNPKFRSFSYESPLSSILEFIETLRNGHKYTTMTPQFGEKLGQQIKINRGVFQGSVFIWV